MQLKARTGPAPKVVETKPKASPFGDAAPVDAKEESEEKQEVKVEETTVEEPTPEPALVEESTAESGDKKEEKKDKNREKKRREPKVINSRAAAFESAPDVKREVRFNNCSFLYLNLKCLTSHSALSFKNSLIIVVRGQIIVELLRL